MIWYDLFRLNWKKTKENARELKNVVHNEKESKDENLLFVQIKMDAAL